MADQIRFLRDVRDHRMTIELDQGVHRSIKFGRPGSNTYYFRLNTWPGRLSFSGDCGDYTFARLHDMFDFFRYAGEEYARTDHINVGYWDEKMTAVCKHGEREELDEAAYQAAVRSCLNRHIHGLPLKDAKDVLQAAGVMACLSHPARRKRHSNRSLIGSVLSQARTHFRISGNTGSPRRRSA